MGGRRHLHYIPHLLPINDPRVVRIIKLESPQQLFIGCPVCFKVEYFVHNHHIQNQIKIEIKIMSTTSRQRLYLFNNIIKHLVIFERIFAKIDDNWLIQLKAAWLANLAATRSMASRNSVKSRYPLLSVSRVLR